MSRHEGAPSADRARFRGGLAVPTAGRAPGYAQTNLIAVPADRADDVAEFCRLNAQACPVLDRGAVGATTTVLAPGADLRTDLPRYRVWRDGELVAEPTDVTAWWREDLVAFHLGCSFTFETALAAAGVPLRHVEQGRNVPMYRTRRPCVPSRHLAGPLVVSMRPVPRDLVDTAVAVTARMPAVHGAPVHVGDPDALLASSIDAPDYGERVDAHPGDVPVFWACGVTPQAALVASRPPFAITHAPGHMLVTDVLDADLVEEAARSGLARTARSLG